MAKIYIYENMLQVTDDQKNANKTTMKGCFPFARILKRARNMSWRECGGTRDLLILLVEMLWKTV